MFQAFNTTARQHIRLRTIGYDYTQARGISFDSGQFSVAFAADCNVLTAMAPGINLVSMKQTDQQADELFREQCRRQMERPLALRIKYGFNRVHKPVLDDAPWRSFDSMAEYRAWCEANLPEYLGFKRAA